MKRETDVDAVHGAESKAAGARVPLLALTTATRPPAGYTRLIWLGPLCMYWLIMIGPAGGGRVAFIC